MIFFCIKKILMFLEIVFKTYLLRKSSNNTVQAIQRRLDSKKLKSGIKNVLII